VTCLEAEPLLNACLDGELDLTGALNVERHLSECQGCAALYASLEHLREEIIAADLKYGPSRRLERRIESIGRRSASGWRNMAVLLAAAAAVVLFFIVPPRTNVARNGETREILDNHLRSLMPDHLVDVPSSDRHTVKPWFQGKTSFSPPVPDLTASGFSLAGGRLEVIRQRPAAAVVYKRREHIINLYVVPADGLQAKPSAEEIDGYHFVRWAENGLSYAAVSDLNAAELRAFADLIRTR
jgi:anti-sigma factor RsiW